MALHFCDTYQKAIVCHQFNVPAWLNEDTIEFTQQISPEATRQKIEIQVFLLEWNISVYQSILASLSEW